MKQMDLNPSTELSLIIQENVFKMVVIQHFQAGLIYIKSLFSLLFYKHQ